MYLKLFEKDLSNNILKLYNYIWYNAINQKYLEIIKEFILLFQKNIISRLISTLINVYFFLSNAL